VLTQQVLGTPKAFVLGEAWGLFVHLSKEPRLKRSPSVSRQRT
jgi:hypothetical protein